MPFLSHPPRPLALALAVLLAALPPLLAGCGPLDTTIGNDPCLLQKYQGNGNGNVGGTIGAYNTLTGQLDALQPPNYTIAAGQDISATLSAISLFQIKIDQQMAYLAHTAPPAPPQATPFLDHVRAAVPELNTGAYMLAQAYLDAHDGDGRAAKDIADEARAHMLNGRRLLALAQRDLADLPTDSVNC